MDAFLDKIFEGFSTLLGVLAGAAGLLGVILHNRVAVIGKYMSSTDNRLTRMSTQLDTCNDKLQVEREYVSKLIGALVEAGLPIPPR